MCTKGWLRGGDVEINLTYSMFMFMYRIICIYIYICMYEFMSRNWGIILEFLQLIGKTEEFEAWKRRKEAEM